MPCLMLELVNSVRGQFNLVNSINQIGNSAVQGQIRSLAESILGVSPS